MWCPRENICCLFVSFISIQPECYGGDHISTYYIPLFIARLVGLVTVELYPIHGV